MSENDVHDVRAGDPLSAWEARTKEIVREVLREEGMTIPLHVREANHQFVAECKEELIEFLKAQRIRRDRWEKIRTQVLGGLILSALGGMATFLYWIGSLALQALSHPAGQAVTSNLDSLPPR